MALQDLTPQLRTRLSRMERAVGWFVIVATLLLVFGFGYYVYSTAERKGWFTTKFHYQTSLNSAVGLKVGDPVKLMGFPAGQITAIVPEAPDAWYGVTISFSILKPHYGYIWDDSKVKVSSDLLGNRFLEITKGVSGVPTIDEDTNKTPQAMLRWKAITAAREKLTAQMHSQNADMERTNQLAFKSTISYDLKELAQKDRADFYTNLDQVYWVPPEESPAVTERLEKLVGQVENALPNILNLTNQLATVLSNAASLTANLNEVAISARPMVTNLSVVTAQLNGPGTLGEWLLPTNVNRGLDSVLTNANLTLANASTNLESLNLSLLSLADLTSNLNYQVQMNTNILSQISKAVQDADDFVQGLKHHWLLRSAFKTKPTNAPPRTVTPVRSPKDMPY